MADVTLETKRGRLELRPEVLHLSPLLGAALPLFSPRIARTQPPSQGEPVGGQRVQVELRGRPGGRPVCSRPDRGRVDVELEQRSVCLIRRSFTETSLRAASV
jgi:hypothetical protein